MSELIFLQDLAIVIVISAATIILCQNLRLPIVLGYILAGLLIGPHTPPYSLVHDVHSIQILSALGVIFLLFSIGLEFSLSKLAKIGMVAFIAATFEIFLMIGIGYSLGKLMGWRQMDSLFLGAILSVSSTTIIAKILIDTKKINEQFAQVILGILVIEDLWAIVIIAILSAIATTGAFTLGAISLSMVKVFIFITGILFFGFLLIPRLLSHIDRFKISEMMVVVSLGLCLGAALLAAKAGFSIALGAFLIGAVIAETKQAKTVIEKMEPIRDMFTAIFFVSVGLLIDPKIIAQYWLLIIVVTIITILGKVFSCSLMSFLTGYDSKTSLKIGLGLAQIGEFSFIIAQLGRDTNVTSSIIFPIAVSVSAITTISTPFLMNNSEKIIEGMKRIIPQPIVTFASLYPSWMTKISENNITSAKKNNISRELIKHVPKFIFYTVSIIAVYVMAQRYQTFFPQLNDSLYWTLVPLITFPLLIGFTHSLDKILWEGFFLNLVKADIQQAKETGELLHNTIRFITAIGGGLIFLLIAIGIVPPVSLVVLILAFILASGTLFWKSVYRIHGHVEKTILSVFDFEKPTNTIQARLTHDELINLIRADYPLSFETQDYLLPHSPSGLNRSIRELDLRSQTGASIVGIYRGEEAIPNPSPDIKLLEGDVLLLIGNTEQIKSAMKYLYKKIKEPL